MLPEVRPSSEIYGNVNILGAEIPVSGIAGDQQAALFGQKCFCEGDIKNTYGTGCFLLMNTGAAAFESKNGLITTIAADAGDNICYALEGSVFVGGAVIQWLRDELGLIATAAESEKAALSVPDSSGSLHCSRLCGAWRALLGYVRPRHNLRAYARQRQKPHNKG